MENFVGNGKFLVSCVRLPASALRLPAEMTAGKGAADLRFL